MNKGADRAENTHTHTHTHTHTPNPTRAAKSVSDRAEQPSAASSSRAAFMRLKFILSARVRACICLLFLVRAHVYVCVFDLWHGFELEDGPEEGRLLALVGPQRRWSGRVRCTRTATATVAAAAAIARGRVGHGAWGREGNSRRNEPRPPTSQRLEFPLRVRVTERDDAAIATSNATTDEAMGMTLHSLIVDPTAITFCRFSQDDDGWWSQKMETKFTRARPSSLLPTLATVMFS